MLVVVLIILKIKNLEKFRSSRSILLSMILTDGPLQIRKRPDGGRVVQREQHVGEHDRPAFGSLLARSRFARRFTDQHTRISCGNARLSVRRFVSAVPFRCADERILREWIP